MQGLRGYSYRAYELYYRLRQVRQVRSAPQSIQIELYVPMYQGILGLQMKRL